MTINNELVHKPIGPSRRPLVLLARPILGSLSSLPFEEDPPLVFKIENESHLSIPKSLIE